MRALELLQIQWVLLMVAVGTAIVALVYLGFMRHGAYRPDDAEIEEFPEGLREAAHGIPPVLILAFTIIALCALGQVVYAWLSGVSY